MKKFQRMIAIVLVIGACLLSTSCVAQQADVVRMKRDIDSRISKLDESKVALQQAVGDANRALREANSIIATQRAEIKELLVARAEVMDQVTTIKDGDLSEVRGAIDQSEHHLQSVSQKIEKLGNAVELTREEAQAREESFRPEVEQLKQQIYQQNEVVTLQAQKLSEFQASFVDFREVLDTVRQALDAQETKLVETNTQILSLSNNEVGNRELAQENWEQVKQSVDSVVSAFEQVSQTLADRLDEHERKLSQMVQAGSEPQSIAMTAGPVVRPSAVGATPVQELRQSIASLSSARDTAPVHQSSDSLRTRDQLFEHKLANGSIDRLDRSKIVAGRSLSSHRETQSVKPDDREMALYQENYEILRAGDLKGALQGFSQFLKHHPRSSLASNAQYWLGECYYGQRQYVQAIREFERVLTYYPSSHKVPAAILKIGYSHLGLQDQKSAHSMFRQLVRSYPKSHAAAKAYARLTEGHQPRKGSF